MKIDRLVSIIMILLEKERISAKELSDMFEVSIRTIYRDVESINLAGIPICSTSGVGGGFEIMQKYKIDKKIFSTNDISTILMGLSSISNMVHGDEILNALAKVKSFIPVDKKKDIEIKSNQILIDLTPWMTNKNIQPYIEIIKDALKETKLLSFEYLSQYGEKTTRKVEPYQLVLKNNQWYFQAFCYMRNDFRLFKISRMANLKIEEETFIPREYQKPMLSFDDMKKVDYTKVKIRIHKSVMERILDFCPYDEFYPDGEDYFIVDFSFIESEYSYDMLMSMGDKCECLEPQRVRQEMKNRIQKMLDMYEGKEVKSK